MKRLTTSAIAASAMTVLLLAGCQAPAPTGPTLTAVPPAGKNLTLFQNDDYACRNYAQRTVAYPAATQNTAGNGVATAAIGTGIGAAAGALFGAVAGNAGAGAAIGAGRGPAGRFGGRRRADQSCRRKPAADLQQRLCAMHDLAGQWDRARRLRLRLLRTGIRHGGVLSRQMLPM